MNTLDAIFARKSTRAYQSEQISEEALETIIKAGCAAPIGMGRYDTLHITVVQNEEMLTKIYKEAEESMFKLVGIRKNMDYGAKTMIVVSSMPAYREGMDAANVGIVIENMGGPMPAIEKSDELKNAIGIPDGFTPILGVALGYAVEDEPAKVHTINVNRV